MGCGRWRVRAHICRIASAAAKGWVPSSGPAVARCGARADGNNNLRVVRLGNSSPRVSRVCLPVHDESMAPRSSPNKMQARTAPSNPPLNIRNVPGRSPSSTSSCSRSITEGIDVGLSSQQWICHQPRGELPQWLQHGIRSRPWYAQTLISASRQLAITSGSPRLGASRGAWWRVAQSANSVQG